MRWLLSTTGFVLNVPVTGTAVTQSGIDTTNGRLMKTGDAGLLTGAVNVADFTSVEVNGGRIFRALSGATGGPGIGAAYVALPYDGSPGTRFIGVDDTNTLRIGRKTGATATPTWSFTYGSQNTTVDANGFLKSASPILRLFSDRTEQPVEPVDLVFERLGVGIYLLSGVEPLAASGWQIEVPQDHNGNRLVFVETGYDPEARSLTVTTTAPEWSGVLQQWAAGEPRDIPEGRWVDLRLAKVPESDQQSDSEAVL